jgi:hypothetical protein
MPERCCEKLFVVLALSKVAAAADQWIDHVVPAPSFSTNSRHKAKGPKPAHAVAERGNGAQLQQLSKFLQRERHAGCPHLLVARQHQQRRQIAGRQLAFINQLNQMQQALPANSDPAPAQGVTQSVPLQRRGQFF